MFKEGVDIKETARPATPPDVVIEQHEDVEEKLEVTAEEKAKLKEGLQDITLERTIKIIKELVYMHESDQNFSGETLNSMKDFLANPPVDDVPEKNETLRLMKLEALLATENSPYAEVRAVADPTDDPDMPCSTLRAWFLGIIFCCFGVFIDTLFAFRYPNISVSANVAQLVAYPAGTFLARVLPKWSFTIRGQKFE